MSASFLFNSVVDQRIAIHLITQGSWPWGRALNLYFIIFKHKRGFVKLLHARYVQLYLRIFNKTTIPVAKNEFWINLERRLHLKDDLIVLENNNTVTRKLIYIKTLLAGYAHIVTEQKRYEEKYSRRGKKYYMEEKIEKESRKCENGWCMHLHRIRHLKIDYPKSWIPCDIHEKYFVYCGKTTHNLGIMKNTPGKITLINMIPT